MARKKSASSTQVTSTKHGDKRKNIPTEELRDFVAEDEHNPEVLLYPRDPSLDPQLVWKGKDDQDRQDLAVPVVPIYIQEKIHPQAIIEDVRAQAKQDQAVQQLSLFDDFNGLEFGEMIEFYQHEQHWSNRMILGDSLMVMTSLAEKEGLKGQVQMIYIDPPYGIKFGSNWQVSTRKRDLTDSRAEDLTRQPEQIRAFRDTWELGIHSYLGYLRDRLIVAHNLLTDSGSVFVQIGEENVHLVRCLLDEVFGSRNSINTIVFTKTSSEETIGLPNTADYLLWYGKDADKTKRHPLYVLKSPGGEGAKQYVHKLSPTGDVVPLTAEEIVNPNLIPSDWKVCRRGFPLTSQHYSSTRTVPFVFEGKPYHPGNNRQWSLDPEIELPKLVEIGRIYSTGKSLNAVMCLEDLPTTEMANVWTDTGTGSFTDKQVYVVQTSEKVVYRCIAMSTDPGDLVIDPTCGSGTTAFVAEKLGRRWITIDTSRISLALARARIMSAVFPFYYLADSQEGIKKQYEMQGAIPPAKLPKTRSDIKKGFIYEQAPHRSLSDVARSTLGQARILYEKPYEDSRRLRVTGPFTVESLSPHRTINIDELRPTTEKTGTLSEADGFEAMILENLKKAGVQNTKAEERLKFVRLEPYPGEWIQAEGEYTDKGGTSKRVALCIGPEHGTVGPQLVKEAAKEAVRGVGFDLLIVCGFAFDPHVSEEAQRYGQLSVLPTRMNPDLAMGDTLLKKTGSGNLFMVFGEPDMEIRRVDGKLQVEIKGLDIYDPTTGEIRSSSVDDIACWFIDTNYNEESFFVRHAYFTGADNPYENLKRALRAEIDEEAWEQLYSTVSRPFDEPETGKIAVKVINHYGDEVLKVYEV